MGDLNVTDKPFCTHKITSIAGEFMHISTQRCKISDCWSLYKRFTRNLRLFWRNYNPGMGEYQDIRRLEPPTYRGYIVHAKTRDRDILRFYWIYLWFIFFNFSITPSCKSWTLTIYNYLTINITALCLLPLFANIQIEKKQLSSLSFGISDDWINTLRTG